MYRNFFKRLIDFLAAFFGLLILSPLFIIITIILYFQNSGKPFFYQRRPGKDEREFFIMKFKTMTDEKDENGELLLNHLRITKVGNFLRKSSLDELPQLINVLKGEMSLIGPRPLLFKYIPLYNEEQLRRHNVRPGITGWAQVNGRNAISWTKKFELDIYYVNNVSFGLDIKIIFMTFLKVVKSEGVNSGEEVTMPPFDGTN
ncbi:sugar transferase [Flavobacterium sp.]|uniref:sugar transferase n=1 Tax=Flavobacterium sp. TaxID=239 RepID=UPI004033578E